MTPPVGVFRRWRFAPLSPASGGRGIAALVACLALLASPVAAQDPLAAQREAMKPLAWMLGTWRGEAWLATPTGRRALIQTEHVTAMLEGTVLVAEGRAFEADGRPTTMNAVGLYLYDPVKQIHALQPSAVPGRFALTVVPNGWEWSMPSGQGRVRYVSALEGGVWRETITQVAADGTTTPIFEMKLKRVGD